MENAPGNLEDATLFLITRSSVPLPFEVVLQAGRKRELDGRRKKTDGVTARALAKRRATLPSKKKSLRRHLLTEMRRRRKNCLNPCGFDAHIQKAITPVTPWIRW